MKTLLAWFWLLSAICGALAQDEPRTTEIESQGEDRFLKPLENRNGWVNPEDLAPMPLCIAQQDRTAWLSAMTKCTAKQCTRHFGRFCTHHQWRTQLTCLDNEFSADVLRQYLPHCSRSVLAEAQLYGWVHKLTGRTWLVDLGDAIELQNLSPASLAEGYAAMDVIVKAPDCLRNSYSSRSREEFRYAMASCGFAAYTRHDGNAARPWEYSESSRSMIELDVEVVGYEITGHYIRAGDYFDKSCFCKTLDIDYSKEPCVDSGLDLTKKRMWLHATCGTKLLPNNWKAGLKTTEFDYIPTKDWQWPQCVNDIPEKVLKLPEQCETKACDTDDDGYCMVEDVVDRSCFCHQIEYNSCRGSCHEFETRIDYVKWLHGVCGGVEGWSGLPKDWHELASITPLDMIPWSWRLESAKLSRQSTDWKFASLALVNAAALVAALYASDSKAHQLGPLRDLVPSSWSGRAITVVAIHLTANIVNAAIVQSSGYESVPLFSMVLLWSSMPRLTWVPLLLAANFDTIAASLLAEVILQLLSSFTMFTTMSYGWEHDFYDNRMDKLASSIPAQLMYAGAGVWLLVAIVAVVLALQFQALSVLDMSPFEQHWSWLEQLVVRRWFEERYAAKETTPLMSDVNRSYESYGAVITTPALTTVMVVKQSTVRGYLMATIAVFLLWVAQWVFWAGFIGVSVANYCPPHLGRLTLSWIASSAAMTVVAGL